MDFESNCSISVPTHYHFHGQPHHPISSIRLETCSKRRVMNSDNTDNAGNKSDATVGFNDLI